MEEKRMATTTAAANNKDTANIHISNEMKSSCVDYAGDILSELGSEFEAAEALKDGVPESVGMFRIKSANKTLQEAKQRPDPKPLWLSLWYEGEVCCLFADSNLGKSIYAVQIAESIAHREKVLYFDFELSDKQFQLRYTDDEGNLFQFPKDLYRVEIDRESINIAANFEDNVITSIENAALQTGSKVLIIDNLTYLCNATEKGDAAGLLMMKLMALKKKYGFSLLILAHTPKRNLSSPITTNDLAGSKKLYNFFDSCFAIGQSAKDSGLRYIKQMKVRHGAFEYGAENVIVCSIDKQDAFLQFVPMDFATEKEHLKEISENDRKLLKEQAMLKKSEGKSVKEISVELGVSDKTLYRWFKK